MQLAWLQGEYTKVFYVVRIRGVSIELWSNKESKVLNKVHRISPWVEKRGHREEKSVSSGGAALVVVENNDIYPEEEFLFKK